MSDLRAEEILESLDNEQRAVVRAATDGTPRERRRMRISPAARAVKVRANTLCGSITLIAAAYAMR